MKIKRYNSEIGEKEGEKRKKEYEKMIQSTLSSFLGLRSGLVVLMDVEENNGTPENLRQRTDGQGVSFEAETSTPWVNRSRQRSIVVRKSPEHNLLSEAKVLKPREDHHPIGEDREGQKDIPGRKRPKKGSREGARVWT